MYPTGFVLRNSMKDFFSNKQNQKENELFRINLFIFQTFHYYFPNRSVKNPTSKPKWDTMGPIAKETISPSGIASRGLIKSNGCSFVFQ